MEKKRIARHERGCVDQWKENVAPKSRTHSESEDELSNSYVKKPMKSGKLVPDSSSESPSDPDASHM